MSVERVAAGPSIVPLLAARWSPRAFDAARGVDPTALVRLFEAMRWAPSCFNAQPARAYVAVRAREPARWQAVLDCLVEGNRGWAQAAPVLVAFAAATRFADGSPNRWATHDTGAAALSVALQAVYEGLAMHQMGGFDVARLRVALALADELEPTSIAALGYLGEPAILSERHRVKELAPRERRPLDELVAGLPDDARR